MNVLSVEYPGYGAYEGEACAKTILEDAEIVFDFLTKEIAVNSGNIILFGRSIGSGPSTHLAANRQPGMLILMSPYTSIRDVVRSIAGKWAQYLVAERFRNIEEIVQVQCPCYFIHGKRDSLIPASHTKDLFISCKALAGMHLSENMTHNDYSLNEDVLKPVKKFLQQICFEIGYASYRFPTYVASAPAKKSKKRTPSYSQSIDSTITGLSASLGRSAAL